MWHRKGKSCCAETFVVWTRPAMYVYRNIETRSCNRYCSRKAISITYYECVFVALGIQHAMRIHQIVNLWRAVLYKTFPHYFLNGMILGNVYWTQNVWSRLLFIQLNAQLDCSRKMLKLTLKFTLKFSYMFRFNKPSSGSLLLCFAKVIFIKIVS